MQKVLVQNKLVQVKKAWISMKKKLLKKQKKLMPMMPMMIKTGADIIDVDHAVTEMARFAPLLSAHQVFSGNSDPVGAIQNGSQKSISESVHKACRASGGRCIVSAGCEITPDTSIENLMLLSDTTRSAREV